MISKNQIKHLHALAQKKHRELERLYVAEGPKTVADLLAAARPKALFATEEWADLHPELARKHAAETTLVSEEELRRASLQQHPQQVIAVFPMDDRPTPSPEGRLTLALDDVQDPGNLGTIVRIADWFGIDTVYCSRATADIYNPKAVQATMGSLARVQVVSVDLPEFLASLPSQLPIYGTLLDGENIYQATLSPTGIIVMGNEGNGISPAVRRLIGRSLRIASYPEGAPTADSLNVAIATAITCSEFRRRAF